MRVRFGDRTLFDDLSLRLEAGRWTCLLGRSGTGKSTLARLVAGLDAGPDSAARIVDDGGHPLRGRTAWMAQQDLLLPWLDVVGNVGLGARLRGERRAARARSAERARELVARVGLAGCEAQLPATLSGGMRQRVALARTLMEDREVVVLDEPFASVDAITRGELQALAFELLEGRTILLITHDPQEALRLGHRVLVLRGTPPELVSPVELEGPPPRPVDRAESAHAQGALVRALRVPEGGR